MHQARRVLGARQALSLGDKRIVQRKWCSRLVHRTVSDLLGSGNVERAAGKGAQIGGEARSPHFKCFARDFCRFHGNKYRSWLAVACDRHKLAQAGLVDESREIGFRYTQTDCRHDRPPGLRAHATLTRGSHLPPNPKRSMTPKRRATDFGEPRRYCAKMGYGLRVWRVRCRVKSPPPCRHPLRV